MRVGFVQHGDYREAVERFDAGGGETYGYQHYTVDAVAAVLPAVESITVACLRTTPYSVTQLSNGVNAVGFDLRSTHAYADVIHTLESIGITHLVLRAPSRDLLSWARRQRLPTLCMLADSFQPAGLKSRVRHWQLARSLNKSHIVWIANHGVNAAKSLAAIGVDARKVIPWDYPPDITPAMYEPKTGRASTHTFRIFYAGVVSQAKGVTDLVDAVALLNEQGHPASLTIAGNAGDDAVAAHIASIRVQDAITLLGRIPQKDVLKHMRSHDAVVVPSRHVYPEGLPITIYEAFCSRTPLVISDHPMFRGRVEDNRSGLVFAEKNAAELANRLQRLMTDADLYQRLSTNAESAWQSLQIPVKWHELIERFVEGPEQHRAWAAEYCLASGRYG